MSSEINLIYREWQEAIRDRYNIKGEQVVVAKPSNPAHLTILKEMCLKAGFTSDQANSILLILEKDDDKYKSISFGRYKLKTDIGPDGKGKKGTPTFTKDDAGNYVKTGDDDEKEDDSPEVKQQQNPNYAKDGEEPKPGQATIDGDHLTSKKPKPKDGKKKELGDMSKEELLSSDHKTVEDTLRYTETQQKADKESGGRAGVGLGTDTSRAGEAAVHTAIRRFKEGKSSEDIEKELMSIAKEEDTYLNAKWVKATMATLNAVEQNIGVENIKDVSWDTPEGRTAIGVDPKLDTSSDMFVRTNDGKNIGISLKQDGSVFLNNGGWAKQSKLLLDGLKEQMPEEDHAELTEAMSIDAFNADRANRFKEVSSKYSPEQILEMTNSLTPEEMKKTQLSPKYIEKLKNSEALLEKANDGKLSGDEMKALHRLFQIKDKEGEQHIRKSDDFLTDKAFSVLSSSPAAKKGMNKHVLKSMHVMDTLGLKKELKIGGVDDFITMYGIPPDGAVLNEKNLTDLFGSEFSQNLLERIDEVRNGAKQPEDLEEFMAEKIEIDYKSGAILFKHENEMKYPLFYMSGRSRGIGSAPVMELGQTSFMALALKVGSFNTDEWTPEQMKKLSDEMKKEKEERDARREKEE